MNTKIYSALLYNDNLMNNGYKYYAKLSYRIYFVLN